MLGKMGKALACNLVVGQRQVFELCRGRGVGEVCKPAVADEVSTQSKKGKVWEHSGVEKVLYALVGKVVVAYIEIDERKGSAG